MPGQQKIAPLLLSGGMSFYHFFRQIDMSAGQACVVFLLQPGASGEPRPAAAVRVAPPFAPLC